MTALLTARRQHFAAALGLHAHAESVRLRAAAFARLVCTLWQSNPPLNLRPFCLQAGYSRQQSNGSAYSNF